MASTLLTSKGMPIQLGRELGRGGEGSVYEIPTEHDKVAKLYHRSHLPDSKKQAKLSFMATTADQQLLDYVAWPIETLHPSKGGPVIGFLMPKVAGRDPIHMVYSPAHRRQERPKAAWDYLLYVARNTAAAFDALHSHGHVLGDVNQGNVMVGNDSKVVLIDSDSMQVNARGTLHLCEVGVAHFTPPELQRLSSFKGFTRTVNHDNFGLALLIFHLLFGGRHPYSGVPLRNGVGESLEGDVKTFRYAYARDAQVRGIAPPPRSIPLSIVPDSVEAMFQLTFTEKGALGARPTASQWKVALDGVRGRLKRCGLSSMHLYSDHLNKCPWCGLEQEGVYYFIDLGSTFTSTGNGFVLAQAWALIEAVPAPQPVRIPNFSSISITVKPLPPGIPGAGTITFYKALVVVGGIIGLTALPGLWFLILMFAWGAWASASNMGSSERREERRRRKVAEEEARREFDALVQRVKKEAGPEGFHQKREELRRIRDEYLALPAEEQKELSKLHSTAQDRQKQKFLERFFIDSADIPGVGPARKTTLRSFGIETAADVKPHRIRQIKGFGDSLTRAVTDWKVSCERKFVFNPATAVSEADKNAVRVKIANRRTSITGLLGAGAGELQWYKQTAAARASALQPQIEAAALKLAQAEKELSII